MSVGTILSKIETGDDIKDDLEKLGLENLSTEHARKLTYHLLGKCHLKQNKSACVDIIDILNCTRIREPLPAITNLYLNPFMNEELIAFVFSCFPNRLVCDYYIELINLGNDVDAVMIAKKLLFIFPTVKHEDWEYLLSLTDDFEEEEYDNFQLRDFFKTKVGETNPGIRVPEWINPILLKKDLPAIPKNIPPVRDAVEMLLDEFTKHKIKIDTKDLNKVKDTFITQYAISTISEKIIMLRGLIDLPSYDDSSIFQEFGPVNAVYGHDADDEHECSKYGGCRMFLCNDFEEEDVDGYRVDPLSEQDHKIQWFKGKCDICYNNIVSYHHALRFPLPQGGWQGCYCQFSCLEQDVEDANTALTVGRIKEQLLTFGIRDR